MKNLKILDVRIQFQTKYEEFEKNRSKVKVNPMISFHSWLTKAWKCWTWIQMKSFRKYKWANFTSIGPSINIQNLISKCKEFWELQVRISKIIMKLCLMRIQTRVNRKKIKWIWLNESKTNDYCRTDFSKTKSGAKKFVLPARAIFFSTSTGWAYHSRWKIVWKILQWLISRKFLLQLKSMKRFRKICTDNYWPIPSCF